MNVLILVFTMLSLLTIMTYTRLQTYLDNAGIRIEYERYMLHAERENIDDLEKRKYNSTKVKTGGSERNQAEGRATLNIRSLLNPAAAAKDQQDQAPQSGAVTQRALLLNRLINILYGDQPFFVEASQEIPNLGQVILTSMAQAAASPVCSVKFSNVNDLANLEMPNAQLQEVYYHMLHGSAPSSYTNAKGDEIQTTAGYPSLLDFVSVETQAKPIRIWLARKPMLQAIFRDPQEIIDRRNELYNYVNNEFMTPEAATKDFNRFSDPVLTDVDLSLLDFTVSKTRPPKD